MFIKDIDERINGFLNRGLNGICYFEINKMLLKKTKDNP